MKAKFKDCRFTRISERIIFYYTLVEIVVVIAILALFAGIVIMRVAKTPAFISAGKIANSIQNLFASASFMAQSSNEIIEIDFDKESRSFRIIKPDGENSNHNEVLSETIPVGMKFSFGDLEEDRYVYRFFPDGMASGKSFTIFCDKHKMEMSPKPCQLS